MFEGRPKQTVLPASFYASLHLSVALLLLGLTLKAPSEMPKFARYFSILPSTLSVQQKDVVLHKKTTSQHNAVFEQPTDTSCIFYTFRDIKNAWHRHRVVIETIPRTDKLF